MDRRVAADTGSDTWDRMVIEEMDSRDVRWDILSLLEIFVRWMDTRIPDWTDSRRNTREQHVRPPESAAGSYSRVVSVGTNSNSCYTGNSCAFSRWISGHRADSRMPDAKLEDICMARSSRTSNPR